MKYEVLVASFILFVASTAAQDTVVAVDPDTAVGGDAAGDSVHYWAVDETPVEDYDGTGDIIIEPDDTWDSAVANGVGPGWNPNDESTREGSGLGGNPDPNDEFVLPQLGDEVVTGPVIEVFEGRDVSESLAAEHGRGGGALGHARGRGRPDKNRRNLRGKKN